MNAAQTYRSWIHEAHDQLRQARNARTAGDRRTALVRLNVAILCRKSAQRVLRRMKINRGLLTIR